MIGHFSRVFASLLTAVSAVACSSQAPDAGASGSHAFLVAAGNGPYAAREAAALSLDGRDRSQLQGILLARLRSQLNAGPVRDDATLLGEIGNATAADELVKMYPTVREDARRDLHEAVAAIWNRDGTHAFDVAEDRYVYFKTRLGAARRLTRQELLSLQTTMLRRIAGDPYEMTIDDAAVLGAIGDEEAAKALERILALLEYDPVTGDIHPKWELYGRLRAEISGAVETIRERCAPKVSAPPAS